MGYCCRIFTPVQPVPPAASVRDFLFGALKLRELLERIDRLIKEYMRASIPEQLAFLEAEITAAKEKLQRIAASLVN